MEERLGKAYEPKAVEDGLYSRWEGSGFFDPDNLPGERTEPFTIMMPPPNATGTLHIGHALFLTLEDLMTRFHRMRGKAALWVPGTDHAAIATNTKVEKVLAKEGKTKYDLGRDAFVERVKGFIAGSQETIRRQIRKMGSSCDWSREAYTFDAQRSRAVREIFVRMYGDGLIYRSNRIVNWCPRCESTLADDEVEYREEKTRFYYFKYGPIVIGTARPETKFLDKTIVVHPEDERYKDLIGKEFDVEWIGGKVKANVIPDPSIDREFGTGAMTITPAHDFHDFDLAQEHGLPVVKIIDEQGNFTDAAGEFVGRNARESREAIVKILEDKGLVERIDDEYVHNVSVCYRCSTPIEPLTSKQWFVGVNREIPGKGKSLKEISLEVVKDGRIRILPDRFEKTYYHWMENLHDWCISRQIWFGHRIPVWYHDTCQNAEDEGVGSGRMDMRPIVAREDPKTCPHCDARLVFEGPNTNVHQDPDTLDTWFSSGTWTFSTLGWPEETDDLKKFHPTQVLETGYDILFFWIARMILMTTYALDEIPFETVYLHGLVRDEQGRKMSKSLENIIDPLDVAAKFGTDAVRMSLVIGNTPGNDIRLSEDKIAHFRNFANKLWNISRFILMTVGDAKVPEGKPQAKTLADRWILARLDEVTVQVTDDIEGFNFSRPGETLRDFTWSELADWYLEVAKIERGKEEILSYVLHTVLKLWHPFMPYVTEEIYGRVFAADGKDFLMVAEWPEVTDVTDGVQDRADFATLQEIVSSIRNIRATYRIEPGKRIDVTLFGGKRADLLQENAEVVKGLVKVGVLTIDTEGTRPEQSASAVVQGVQIFVPLAGIVDVETEKARLSKETEETERYLASLDKKLGNASFAERAPVEVVEAERQKKKDAEEKLERLKEQIAALQ